MRWLFYILIVFFLASGILLIAFFMQPQKISVSTKVTEITKSIADQPPEETDKSKQEEDQLKEITEEEVLNTEEELSETTIRPSTQLSVPFIVQAPFADWSERYKETCEEASVLMVHHFYELSSKLSQQEMKDAIDPLTDWGDEYFNKRFDTNLEETSKYFTEYFDYNPNRLKFISNPSIEDLKALIDAGLPVIIPAAGRELGNKYFQTPGPVYHMLVITGYDRNEFITNDPGTRRGEDYRYNQQTLIDAIHDWTGDYETILEGKKVALVVTPEV